MIQSKVTGRGVDLHVLPINQTVLVEIKRRGSVWITARIQTCRSTNHCDEFIGTDTETSKLMRYFYENWLGGMENIKRSPKLNAK